MRTPIADFVRRYAESESLRLHMPGHKGVNLLGMESIDITEIKGADSLYEAEGIIRESELNAGELFGADTYYSAEGSSLSIRAMLYLAVLYAKEQGKRPIVMAGRNAHKTFVSAAALLDFDTKWLYPRDKKSYLSCEISGDELEYALMEAEELPTAVYLTTPDYLGNTVDLCSLSRVCKKYGVLLLVDNAHGAYLRFLPESRHPIDLGADMCCDSAHKTLPVLTGGAYLHISKAAPDMFKNHAKDALALFGSTSPSYLILQSLDLANEYISAGYRENLSDFINIITDCRRALTDHGYILCSDEPIKLTINTKPYGYDGRDFASCLEEQGIVCEFADNDYCVMMLTPEIGAQGITRLADAMLDIPKLPEISIVAPEIHPAEPVISVREAVFSPAEVIPASKSAGRILANATVVCPPAVPIVVCGERINESAVQAFEYYGIDKVTVLKE